MPEDGIETLSHFDAIYLGAVGYPGVPDHISLRDLLLRIRHDFDQYVNLRPVKLLKGAPCPLVGITEKDIDMVFIRENSGGEYAGSGVGSIRARRRFQSSRTGPAFGTERIMRYACRTGKKEHRSLTSISKGAMPSLFHGFWDQIFCGTGKGISRSGNPFPIWSMQRACSWSKIPNGTSGGLLQSVWGHPD